jgi:Zn-dependent protease with chaperone function
MKKYLLWLLGVVLTLLDISRNSMLLIFPMWIFTYLSREPLRRLVRGVPLSVSFIGFGLFFGLLTEVFAILNNRQLPPEQRILLSPNPWLDLVYGVFYYLMLIATWYGLIRAFTYSKSEVFVFTGIYGIMTEEVGQVFLRIFRVPVIGLLYAVIILFVYGIFPMLAYVVCEEKLAAPKRGNLLTRFLAAAVALFLEWAIYGLFVLPALKRVFQGA